MMKINQWTWWGSDSPLRPTGPHQQRPALKHHGNVTTVEATTWGGTRVAALGSDDLSTVVGGR